MPDLVHVRLKRAAPAEAAGVEPSLIQPLEVDRPFDVLDLHVDSGGGHRLLDQRQHFLLNRAGRDLKHGEDEFDAVLLQNAVAVGVTPAGFGELPFRLFRIVRPRSD